MLMVFSGGSLLLHAIGLIDFPYIVAFFGWIMLILAGYKLPISPTESGKNGKRTTPVTVAWMI